jgi:hypothetical protein
MEDKTEATAIGSAKRRFVATLVAGNKMMLFQLMWR